MNKFKSGERILIITDEMLQRKHFIGKVGIIENTYFHGYQVRVKDKVGGFCERELQKIGGSMSKFEDLKQRIEALDDGWNKEADDILEEIGQLYDISIPTTFKGNRGWVKIFNQILGYDPTGDTQKRYVEKGFYYDTQYEKLEAFKKALHWLLDHSSVKKDERNEEIKELKEQVKEIQKKIEKLEK